MKNLLTKKELIAFEDDIAATFNASQIKSPVHLYHDNEHQMIEVFKHVNEDDWICTSWRSHYQCLLKGVPPKELKEAILQNRSISLCFKEYKVISSAIVAGIIPIALGIAYDIKRKGETNKVWCFVGDMTSMHGAFTEALNYAHNHQLPITFVVEDNGKSVCTDTRDAWGQWQLDEEPEHDIGQNVYKCGHVWYYKYNLDKYPHAGAGQRVQF